MTPMPLIALTMYGANAMGRVELQAEYHQAVRRAGGRPLLIPAGDQDPVGLLDLVDGLVFTGGGDIDPILTGGDPHPTIYGTNSFRDEFEIELMKRALDRDVPMLLVCRGLQVLNTVLGGTLHAHLPDIAGDGIVHRDDPPGPVPHTVQLEPDSLVGKVMGTTEVTTASWHHQSIDQPGTGLRVVATAADGIIEAVELDGYPFLEAVQWHPEITAAHDPTQQALFDELVIQVSAGPERLTQ